MKLIKQVQLAFQEGKSDKVYEVDLCEVGTDQFVVNFRYGRRDRPFAMAPDTGPGGAGAGGESLRRSRAVEARQGLSRSRWECAAATGCGPPAPSMSASENARAQAVLSRLRERSTGRGRAWPIDRVIWRAGELGLREAEPLLLQILNERPESLQLRSYAVAWALGRCGSVAAVPALEGFVPMRRCIWPRGGSRPRRCCDSIHRRIARSCSRDSRTSCRVARQAREGGAGGCVRARVPTNSHSGAARCDLHGLRDRFGAHPAGDRQLLSRGCVRQGTVPAATSHLQDRGVSARRAGVRDPRVSHREGTIQVLGGLGQLAAAGPLLQLCDAAVLPIRSWRTLRRLGELGDEDYAKMAAGVLLEFTDEDAGRSRTGQSGDVYWGPYSGYWAFNKILYEESPRFYPDRRGRFFRSRGVDVPPPKAREESFPRLWDAAPLALMHLLQDSECAPVHEFAVKAVRENPEFLETLDGPVAIMLLARPYEGTAALGFEIAQRVYDEQVPDVDLLVAMAESICAPARVQGHRWIEVHRSVFAADEVALARLALAATADTRALARSLLLATNLTESVGRGLVTRLLAALQAMAPDDDERAMDVVETLIRVLADHVSGLGRKSFATCWRVSWQSCSDWPGISFSFRCGLGGPCRAMSCSPCSTPGMPRRARLEFACSRPSTTRS